MSTSTVNYFTTNKYLTADPRMAVDVVLLCNEQGLQVLHNAFDHHPLPCAVLHGGFHGVNARSAAFGVRVVLQVAVRKVRRRDARTLRD